MAAYPMQKSSRTRPSARKASGTKEASPRAYAAGMTAVTTVSGAAAARAKNTRADAPRRPAASVYVEGSGGGIDQLKPRPYALTTACDLHLTEGDKIGTTSPVRARSGS